MLAKRRVIPKEIHKCLGFPGETLCSRCQRKDKDADYTLVIALVVHPEIKNKFCEYYLK